MANNISESAANLKWLDKNLTLKQLDNKHEQAMPSFPLPTHLKEQSKKVSDGLDLSFCTLHHVKEDNILSTVGLMEVGMCVAHVDNEEPSDDVCVFDQKASWDCVHCVRALLGMNRDKVTCIPLAGRALACALSHKLFFNGLLWPLKGVSGKKPSDVLREGETFCDTQFSHANIDHIKILLLEFKPSCPEPFKLLEHQTHKKQKHLSLGLINKKQKLIGSGNNAGVQKQKVPSGAQQSKEEKNKNNCEDDKL